MKKIITSERTDILPQNGVGEEGWCSGVDKVIQRIAYN